MFAVRAGWLMIVLVVSAPLVATGGGEPKDLDKIPKKVIDALKTKFPKIKIDKWTKETEDGKVVYDIEGKENGRKCEADIAEDGTIINYEKEIEEKDLPKIVRAAIEKRYPKSKLKEVMEETTVKGKEEFLSAYEVVLQTVAKKEVEVRVSPKGEILEDTGAKKADEKK